LFALRFSAALLVVGAFCLVGGLALAAPPLLPRGDVPDESTSVASGVTTSSDGPLFRGLGSTLFVATPIILNVASVAQTAESAQITDLRVADFDGDGRNDLCVAWFISDYTNPTNNVRKLSFWWGTGLSAMLRGADIDLYIPDPNVESLSVFRNGPSQIAIGDFDGDGDPDLAVLPYFGDELWFIENLGNRQFFPHLRFTFGFNTTGNFQTPPEAGAADFDGDGRDDLVYIADPIQHIQGLPVHFWRTDSNIASIERVEWLGLVGGSFMSFIRSLAIADFDGDGHPDLALSGSLNPTGEDQPVVGFWYGLNPINQTFRARFVPFPFAIADLVPVRGSADCRAGLAASDDSGSQIAFWGNSCAGAPEIQWVQTVSGFAASSPIQGMALEVGDVNGDGQPDIVTRQRLGDNFESRRVEIALGGAGGQAFELVTPSPIDTTGLGEADDNPIIRPHSLAVADLFGNRLPEIIAGFGVMPPTVASDRVLRVAIWANSCEADINRDGSVDLSDLAQLLAAIGCRGDFNYSSEADLDRDGCVNLTDLSILLGSFGCGVAPQ